MKRVLFQMRTMKLLDIYLQKNHMKEMNLEFYLYTGKKGQKESRVKKTKAEKLFKKMWD